MLMPSARLNVYLTIDENRMLWFHDHSNELVAIDYGACATYAQICDYDGRV